MCIRDRPKGAIYRSTNNGDNWTQVAANGCDMYTKIKQHKSCLLYTSDAADERSSVDLGGRRIIKKKTKQNGSRSDYQYII